jgi:hypothetical protein
MASYEVSILGTMSGKTVVNVHGYTVGDAFGAETGVEAAEAAERAFLAWKQHLVPPQSNKYQVQSAVARGVLDGGISGVSISAPLSGSAVASALPTFVACRLKLQATASGRAGRGRTGIAGVPEEMTDVIDTNRLVPAYVTQMQTAANAWRAQLNSGVPIAALTVISRVLKKITRVVPLVTEVTSVTVDSTVGTRVSRLR